MTEQNINKNVTERVGDIFIEYSMKIMPYIMFIGIMWINWMFFLADRPRIIEVTYSNYILFVGFTWIALLMFFFIKTIEEVTK